MDEGIPAVKAAVAAGYTRVRPVLMTALAMIIGMVPMALGFGEGGEQNAPLGRAVIGGLLFATVATLFFVIPTHADSSDTGKIACGPLDCSLSRATKADLTNDPGFPRRIDLKVLSQNSCRAPTAISIPSRNISREGMPSCSP